MKPMLRLSVTIALLLALVVCGSWAASKGNPNPGVAPPNSSAYGKTYGEWAQAWWTWAAAIPDVQSPLFVDTNEAAHIGQTQKVFFLAGALDGVPHERDVTVPPGTPLFFPIINAIWWAPDDLMAAAELAAMLGLDLDPTDPADTEPLLRLIAEYSMQAYPGQDPPELSVVVDGKDLNNLLDYRAVSPDLFSLDDTDLLGDLPDRMFVADGYWVLLNPLSAGKHTIHITGAISDGPFDGFAVDVTYHLTVKQH